MKTEEIKATVRTQSDLLNLIVATLGVVHEISLSTGAAAVQFKWEGKYLRVDENLIVSMQSNGCMTRDLATSVMERLFRYAAMK